MMRTQIELTEEQSALIKQAAAERHITVAEMIRQGLDFFLQRGVANTHDSQIQRAIAVAGRFRSGKTDVSTRHDDHLAEAYRP